MASLVRRQVCLACTHHAAPCCDGSGVRLIREPDGQVVDVQLCPRWPASWDEPLAYFEALVQYDVDAAQGTAVTERIWPAVQAEVAKTRQAEVEQPTYAEAAPGRALGVVLAGLSAVVVIIIVTLVVLW